MATVVFKDSKVNLNKLIDFGFIKGNSDYLYETKIVDEQFLLEVTVTPTGQIDTQLIDLATKTEYILHLTAAASGKFVGEVAAAYQDVLDQIQAKCFDKDVFKAQQAVDIIKYIDQQFGDQLEFLWKKFPHNAIWRRDDTNKWYSLLSMIPKSKLGLDSEEVVTVIDLRVDADEMNNLIDNVKYFPGYHMNKKSWYTIILDNSVPTTEIMERLQASYQLAK